MITLLIAPTSITLESKTLELKPAWLEIIALAALRSHEENPEVQLLDIPKLPSWQTKDLNVIKASLSREHKKWIQKLGTPIFVGQLGKAFKLNPALTPAFTESLEAVRASLQPKGRLLAKLENPDAEAQANLMLAKLSIETGKLEAALATLENALDANASTDLKQEALFYQARAYEFNGQYTKAKQSLQRLKKCIEWHEQHNSRSEPRAKAWHSIGLARIHLRAGEWEKAKTAYLIAKKHLEPHHYRELGMIFNGLGRVAQNSEALNEAQKHYETALEVYHRAEWVWAVQGSLNDLGVTFKLRCELLWKHNQPKAQKYLEQAFRYFMLCHQNCQAANTGDESAVVEINLAWSYRMFGQYDTAKEWIERAIQLATKANNLSDLGYAHMEYAELERIISGKIAAANQYHLAYNAFDQEPELGKARDTAKFKLDEVLR
jgi:tetratricopeptide (TPR) repeat protein